MKLRADWGQDQVGVNMSKIFKHPDKDEIIRRLNDGGSIRKTSTWLKEKHPNNKSLHISTVSLQKFRKENLQLDGKVLKDIQEAASTQIRHVDEQQRLAELESTSAYQDKINEIADTHLDVTRKIMQLDKIIDGRMEYWFNAIGEGDATPQQADKELRQYMDRQMALLQQYKKFVEGVADQTIEHNVNVTVINEQIGVIRDIIREVMNELSPDLAMLFIEKLNNKLGDTKYLQEPSEEVSKKALDAIEVQVLEGEVI